MHVVEVSHIVKSYNGKKAVNDISFQVEPGEVFGLIGPNGAEKSTTIRMIMNIISPDSGSVLILGEKWSEEKKCHWL
jgi:ABC-2 type transport system ATP-binding protein